MAHSTDFLQRIDSLIDCHELTANLAQFGRDVLQYLADILNDAQEALPFLIWYTGFKQSKDDIRVLQDVKFVMKAGVVYRSGK